MRGIYYYGLLFFAMAYTITSVHGQWNRTIRSHFNLSMYLRTPISGGCASIIIHHERVRKIKVAAQFDNILLYYCHAPADFEAPVLPKRMPTVFRVIKN